jgi:3'(2'), 5'-bisphosphate nucleotidase
MIEFTQQHINELLSIAQEAGEAILNIYNNADTAQVVTFKADASPLTLADAASHEVLAKRLQALFPQIPLLSEEGRDIAYEERKNWHTFWCIDPLDGTKEFVKRNGEFTVNIALIQEKKPVLGIIYVPVTGVMYYGGENLGSWKIDAEGTRTRLLVKNLIADWTAVGSRTHASPEEAELLNRYPVTNKISVGSSLKFCLLAEGLAQIYYRHGPTMEWDTAAGQAILTFSNGKVTTPEGEPFTYNKESLLNGSFLCTVQ